MINERRRQMENEVSDLAVLREYDKRGALDEKFQKILTELEAKKAGLKGVIELFEKHGKDHWIYMTDVALDYHSIITCDLGIMTATHLYAIGINHYEGVFEFKSGVSRVNNEILEEHPIQMIQSVTSQLQSSVAMTPNPVTLKVKGAALFTHPANQLQIHDEVKDIQIVPAKEIKGFIKQIANEEKQMGGNARNVNPMNYSFIGRIDRYHPIFPIEIPKYIKENVRPGIMCKYCRSCDIRIGEVLSQCDCGGWENTEDAVIRTVAEYFILNPGLDAGSFEELFQFIGDQVPHNQVKEYLHKVISMSGW